jgi:hypothetical protein
LSVLLSGHQNLFANDDSGLAAFGNRLMGHSTLTVILLLQVPCRPSSEWANPGAYGMLRDVGSCKT